LSKGLEFPTSFQSYLRGQGRKMAELAESRELDVIMRF